MRTSPHTIAGAQACLPIAAALLVLASLHGQIPVERGASVFMILALTAYAGLAFTKASALVCFTIACAVVGVPLHAITGQAMGACVLFLLGAITAAFLMPQRAKPAPIFPPFARMDHDEDQPSATVYRHQRIVRHDQHQEYSRRAA